jgi:hypothetical protein
VVDAIKVRKGLFLNENENGKRELQRRQNILGVNFLKNALREGSSCSVKHREHVLVCNLTGTE